MSRFVARDRQTVTGKNLWLVQKLSNLNPWTVSSRRLKTALQAEEHVTVSVSDRSARCDRSALPLQSSQAEGLGSLLGNERGRAKTGWTDQQPCDQLDFLHN